MMKGGGGAPGRAIKANTVPHVERGEGRNPQAGLDLYRRSFRNAGVAKPQAQLLLFFPRTRRVS